MAMRPYALLAAAVFALPSALFAAGAAQPKPANEVVVWTYDSFTSEWGPGPQIAENFKAETGISVRFVTQGDGGTLLSRLIAEGTKADADIILGLDQNLAPRALASGLLRPFKPAGADAIPAALILDPDFRLIPFDYSYFAVVYDSERISRPPRNLEDLTREEFKGKLILMDPRTSTPGLGFLAWTMEVYGKEWPEYWRRLAPSILTISEGWDTGYGLFTAGEAPMVLSYTTSPAYHLEFEQTERYKAALFSEGHPVQIEAAGLLAAAKRPENAKRFLDFMLSEGFQSVIPVTNWMYPVTGLTLPASYRLAPKSPRTLLPSAPSDGDLARWAGIFSSR